MEYPESFPTLKHAEDLQNLYFSTVGRSIRRWQHDTLQLADKQCYLENCFGTRCYYWSIFTWDSRRRQMVMGNNAKDALSFLPQSTVADILKRAVLRIKQRGYADVLRWWIHDALLMEVEESRLDEVIAVIGEEMQRPIPELGGLSLEVEWAKGKNWGQMEGL